MNLQNYTQEQVNDIVTTIRNNNNSFSIYVYAIQDKNTGSILNYKNNMFYITRKQARDVRRSIPRDDIKVVKTQFANIAPWKTAK